MNGESTMSPAARFAAAVRRFDEANAQDPNRIREGESEIPREWAYSRWLSGWVDRLAPSASEALRLAARCQHLCRWLIPRDAYPLTRGGYLRWREELRRFHAAKAGEILQEVGYSAATIHQVQDLVLKKHFPADPESCVLEDALCLVFLERQLADLARRSDEAKVVNALQKSWKKMTPAAREIALRLPYGPEERRLLDKALLK
jgi:hypothetical protein